MNLGQTKSGNLVQQRSSNKRVLQKAETPSKKKPRGKHAKKIRKKRNFLLFHKQEEKTRDHLQGGATKNSSKKEEEAEKEQ